jgi:hypothetical protein
MIRSNVRLPACITCVSQPLLAAYLHRALVSTTFDENVSMGWAENEANSGEMILGRVVQLSQKAVRSG